MIKRIWYYIQTRIWWHRFTRELSGYSKESQLSIWKGLDDSRNGRVSKMSPEELESLQNIVDSEA